jgi:hypothetical protein
VKFQDLPHPFPLEKVDRAIWRETDEVPLLLIPQPAHQRAHIAAIAANNTGKFAAECLR